MVVADRTKVVEFFSSSAPGLEVYDAVAALVDGLGPATVRVTRSQVSFRRRVAFGWLWLPGAYLSRPRVEVVLSVALDRSDDSQRWKEVAHVRPDRWMHHLEVSGLADLDDEVEGWVGEAYRLAG